MRLRIPSAMIACAFAAVLILTPAPASSMSAGLTHVGKANQLSEGLVQKATRRWRERDYYYYRRGYDYPRYYYPRVYGRYDDTAIVYYPPYYYPYYAPPPYAYYRTYRYERRVYRRPYLPY